MARKQKRTDSDPVPHRALLPIVCSCLWLAVLASALGVVYSTFETRRATQELEELRREAADLQVESGQYLLEKSTLAAYTRVEAEAESKLDMQVPSVEDLHMVRY